MLSMHKINDNMYLCTDKPRKIEVDKKTFRYLISDSPFPANLGNSRLTQMKDNTKPIVMMISWFYGKPSQINKYATLYTDNGMDVLVTRISLMQFLFAIKGVEVSDRRHKIFHQKNHNLFACRRNLLKTFSRCCKVMKATTRKSTSTLFR